ncbi:hypothetical protein BZA05DRAFT_371346 [Tricharina praecox]|uniref:uncharacterized protein n=1 Tax=Tricharina praecox TaxID=43433 RepID=UPI00221EEB7B|nr:uncharacterized protein BZA05DRAFT_371346 [Tricharina praecox]KAI5854183.1 hypothetical protein BZA05DRAFT_371346 [Tricharina praecox]
MPSTTTTTSSSSVLEGVSTAHTALLRLSRRHSLPTAVLLSLAPTTTTPQHHRSASVTVNTQNRHRYGHRHTRSEWDQPVIVKSYSPPREDLLDEVFDEDEMDTPLPSVDDFSWDGILKAVEPEVNTALASFGTLCGTYRTTLQASVDSLTSTQTSLQSRILMTDGLVSHVLRTTKSRTDRLTSENTTLKNVDALAEAAEETHTVLTSIISTLLAIDEMLPPQERLSPESSASRNHFPKLHTLLVGKAAELNICFGSGRRPTTTTATTTTPAATYPPLRRRLSSSSQILLSGGGSGTNALPAPHLHLKTLLPTNADIPPASRYSTSSSGSGEGAYFPIASQTATGVSLTHSNGNSSTTTNNILLTKPATVATRTNSGSWSVLFGGGGKRDGAAAESAQDRLRGVLEGGRAGGKGKGKGKGKSMPGLGSGW